jgi:hypothetical protein
MDAEVDVIGSGEELRYKRVEMEWVTATVSVCDSGYN